MPRWRDASGADQGSDEEEGGSSLSASDSERDGGGLWSGWSGVIIGLCTFPSGPLLLDGRERKWPGPLAPSSRHRGSIVAVAHSLPLVPLCACSLRSHARLRCGSSLATLSSSRSVISKTTERTLSISTRPTKLGISRRTES